MSGLHFGLEIRLAIFAWHEVMSLELQFGCEHLHVMGVLEVLNCGWVRAFRVFVPVESLHDIVETALGFPLRLVFFLLFCVDLIFVDQREGKGEVVFGVGVELGLILCNLLSELFFLELPYIKFLVTILEHVHSFRDV